MKRNYEGTIRLQGIGVVEGIKAKNIKIGDELVWNFGGTSKVVAIEFSKTGKTLTITTEVDGVEYQRRLNAERIVAVKELNPAEEVEVSEKATTEEQEFEKLEELEELIVVKSDELEEVQNKIQLTKAYGEIIALRDKENELKWEIWSMIELLQKKREELGIFVDEEKQESFEALEKLEEAKRFLELTKKYKKDMFYCEGQSFYKDYKYNYNGKVEIYEFENPKWLIEYLRE